MALTQGDVFADSNVTDGNGNAVFNIAALGLANPPVVGTQVVDATADYLFARVTAVSATSVTVNVRKVQGIVVALLGLTILVTPVPAAGVTVHIQGTAT